MKTTLNQIKAKSPCTDGWKKLLKYLGKTKADDESLSILTVLESNGLDDAVWCLRAVEGKDKEIRFYTVWCARQVQHSMTDKRSIDALDVAKRFANGLANGIEFNAARAAAWAASDAASDAAWSAAGATAGATAWSAARAAAWAASSSAWNATRAARAAWVSAGDATRDAQTNKLIEICAE